MCTSGAIHNGVPTGPSSLGELVEWAGSFDFTCNSQWRVDSETFFSKKPNKIFCFSIFSPVINRNRKLSLSNYDRPINFLVSNHDARTVVLINVTNSCPWTRKKTREKTIVRHFQKTAPKTIWNALNEKLLVRFGELCPFWRQTLILDLIEDRATHPFLKQKNK